MARTLWFSLTLCLLLALTVALPGAETKGKGKGKGAKVEVEAVAEKPAANPEDVAAFRKRDDAAAIEVVTLHDEIDKAYTDLRTATHVAKGDDKEARKAKGEIRTLEARIKRQSRKLETAVEKVALPFERDYNAAKRKYETLQGRAKQYEDQKREKNAAATYQQAARYTDQLEAAKRELDAARSFLTFESAVGLDLGGDDKDDRDAGSGRGGQGRE